MAAPDISEALASYVDAQGLSYQRLSLSYVFDCPRCGKRKLYMYRRTGYFTCWVCDGFKGRPEKALTEIVGQPIRAIRKALYPTPEIDWEAMAAARDKRCTCTRERMPGGAYVKIDDDDCQVCFGEEEEPEVVEPEEKPIPTVLWPLNWHPIDDPRSQKGAAYLAGRGISLEVARAHQIRYSPADRAIVFPVTYCGRLVGWQTRLIFNPEKGSKANTMSGMPREKVVMFENSIEGDSVVLCEGPIDAIKARLCGGAVATLGKKVSRGQIERLVELGVRRFYLALDVDAPHEAARLTRELCDAGYEVYRLQAPMPYGDLGDMPAEEVLQLYQSAPKLRRNSIWTAVRSKKVSL